jgi:hypothetical protein
MTENEGLRPSESEVKTHFAGACEGKWKIYINNVFIYI